jgi:hypothetical protein
MEGSYARIQQEIDHYKNVIKEARGKKIQADNESSKVQRELLDYQRKSLNLGLLNEFLKLDPKKIIIPQHGQRCSTTPVGTRPNKNDSRPAPNAKAQTHQHPYYAPPRGPPPTHKLTPDISSY